MGRLFPSTGPNLSGHQWRHRCRDVADAFAGYARTCFEQFGDRVKYWITFNEVIHFIMRGYRDGIHPLEVKDERRAVEVSHIVNVAHAKAIAEYRQLVQEGDILEGKIGIAPYPVTWLSNQ
ncbi:MULTISPECIES: family 1 glycosylhydrolase [unclassified Leptolyngbya]|uniref:family 1 glycosylhydrolase n=1 Tax=unclassified Leptolyngbya TaxID=2650499 RepID=UPI001F54B5B3|nr:MULTISPECIES: family 1 glycosylhydrolase [unclassified Leptolyngbya]